MPMKHKITTAATEEAATEAEAPILSKKETATEKNSEKKIAMFSPDLTFYFACMLEENKNVFLGSECTSSCSSKRNYKNKNNNRVYDGDDDCCRVEDDGNNKNIITIISSISHDYDITVEIIQDRAKTHYYKKCDHCHDKNKGNFRRKRLKQKKKLEIEKKFLSSYVSTSSSSCSSGDISSCSSGDSSYCSSGDNSWCSSDDTSSYSSGDSSSYDSGDSSSCSSGDTSSCSSGDTSDPRSFRWQNKKKRQRRRRSSRRTRHDFLSWSPSSLIVSRSNNDNKLVTILEEEEEKATTTMNINATNDYSYSGKNEKMTKTLSSIIPDKISMFHTIDDHRKNCCGQEREKHSNKKNCNCRSGRLGSKSRNGKQGNKSEKDDTNDDRMLFRISAETSQQRRKAVAEDIRKTLTDKFPRAA